MNYKRYIQNKSKAKAREEAFAPKKKKVKPGKGNFEPHPDLPNTLVQKKAPRS